MIVTMKIGFSDYNTALIRQIKFICAVRKFETSQRTQKFNSRA